MTRHTHSSGAFAAKLESSDVIDERMSLYHHDRHEEKEVNDREKNTVDIRNYERRRLNPTSGNITALVILGYFTGQNSRDVSGFRPYFNSLWNGDIARWFSLNSHGNYEITATLSRWLDIGNTEEFYAAGVSGRTNTINEALFGPLDSLNSDGWDWSSFDSNNDGLLDAVVLLHTGWAAETGTIACTNEDPADRIWSQGFPSSAGFDTTWTTPDGAYALDGFTIASVYDQPCEFGEAGFGVMVHEFMHSLDSSVIDLYDANTLEGGVGAFDIMGFPFGPQNNVPGHLSTYSKMQVGWIDPTWVTADGNYTLRPAETNADAIILRTNFPVSEYLLLENRQQIEFDADLWTSGLVIYHVDDFADMSKPGFPGQSGWPENGNHYRVAVLQADGNYDLEQSINQGDAGDFWAEGTEIGPGQSNTVFPNTDAYRLNFLEETGITIKVLPKSDVTSNDVTVQITGLSSTASTPSPGSTPPPTAPPPTLPPGITASPTTSQAPSRSPSLSPTTPPPTLKPSIFINLTDLVIVDANTGVIAGSPASAPSPVPPTSPGTGSSVLDNLDLSDLVIIDAPTGVIRSSETTNDNFLIFSTSGNIRSSDSSDNQNNDSNNNNNNNNNTDDDNDNNNNNNNNNNRLRRRLNHAERD